MQKHSFICSSCSYKTPKWIGSCPECKTWGSFTEYTISKKSTAAISLVPLQKIADKTEERMVSGIHEWDRVLGGGIVPGSFIILTGDPGIGKSTLLLQMATALSKLHTVIYISSEESLEQVKGRAKRLKCHDSSILFSDQAQLECIVTAVQAHKPQVIIIDSLQNCYSDDQNLLPGSIGQLKEAAFKLMRLAKEHHTAVLVSGHITKEGAMAGPKTLEHLVDGVFYLQGEEKWHIRVLRSVKNRFGTINELGFFEMNEEGLREADHINQYLLDHVSASPGSVLTCSREGSRSLLVEFQALCIQSKFGLPQRVISGIDAKQVALIAAILEKYLHINLSSFDIFFKISGSIKVKENASDLAIALALLSSFFEQPLPDKTIALGEISLTGLIKPVNYASMHITEATQLGCKNFFVAHHQKIESTETGIRYFKSVYELTDLFS